MTALETWCLAMIGLVFESLLAYVVILLSLFRGKTYQVYFISDWSMVTYSERGQTIATNLLKWSVWLTNSFCR